jgi:leucyl aminopeptidase
MKKIIGLAALLPALSFATVATNQDVYITTGSDAIKKINKSVSSSARVLEQNSEGMTLLKISKDKLPHLSEMMHEEFQRCAGFVQHESLAEAKATMNNVVDMKFAQKGLFTDYTITKGDTVNSMLSHVKEANIRETITKLSSYKNRYYKSKTGVASSNWIADNFKAITSGRTDISVELFNHSRWPQPSVIATVTGTESPDEIIIIGGHADSIAGYFGRANAHAPGADDNASGIATLTEALRVLVETGYRPAKTIKFMAYSAEEVGLLGSKAIANDFKAKGLNVIGVMQLDMTNFNGSQDVDIALMTDFTNANQNEFIGNIIDKYVHVKWGFSKCGYGCSDHASWHNAGYPASMPFESTMQDMNKKIHTANDTLANLRGDAIHAEKFAKLAIAYMVELAK